MNILLCFTVFAYCIQVLMSYVMVCTSSLRVLPGYAHKQTKKNTTKTRRLLANTAAAKTAGL